MDVCIVIVSYNGCAFLRQCLASIYGQTHDLEFEVVVVDNASLDGTADMVDAEFPQARLIRRASNAGFASAANEGLRAARGEALMLINPDSELCGNVLPPMLQYLRQHPDVGILAPKLLDPGGTLQLSVRRFPSFQTALFNRYSLLTRLLPNNRYSRGYLMTDFDHAAIQDVDWASGACWLLPRRAYDEIGPLDEGYFWAVEDVDYCQRAHRSGWRVVYFPEVAVRHHIGISSATLPNRAIVARHRGMWRYYRTYLRPRSPLAWTLDIVVAAGIGGRAATLLATNNLRRLMAKRRS
jgi:GT2 family glycosyltransferase